MEQRNTQLQQTPAFWVDFARHNKELREHTSSEAAAAKGPCRSRDLDPSKGAVSGTNRDHNSRGDTGAKLPPSQGARHVCMFVKDMFNNIMPSTKHQCCMCCRGGEGRNAQHPPEECKLPCACCDCVSTNYACAGGLWVFQGIVTSIDERRSLSESNKRHHCECALPLVKGCGESFTFEVADAKPAPVHVIIAPCSTNILLRPTRFKHCWTASLITSPFAMASAKVLHCVGAWLVERQPDKRETAEHLAWCHTASSLCSRPAARSGTSSRGPHQFWGSSTYHASPTSFQQRLGGWFDKRWNLPRGARNSGVTKRLGAGRALPPRTGVQGSRASAEPRCPSTAWWRHCAGPRAFKANHDVEKLGCSTDLTQAHLSKEA